MQRRLRFLAAAVMVACFALIMLAELSLPRRRLHCVGLSGTAFVEPLQ